MDSGNGETLGEYVKRIRLEKNLTVEAVSEKSGKNSKGSYNISSAYVNKIENESPNVSAPKLDSLAKGLGVSRAAIYAVAYNIEFDSKAIPFERFSKIADGYLLLNKPERESIEPLLAAIEMTIERAVKNQEQSAAENQTVPDDIPSKTLNEVIKIREKKLINGENKKK
jgi:transcriptional regulator with XRE-family HTH domain